jgi:hypothetical protein
MEAAFFALPICGGKSAAARTVLGKLGAERKTSVPVPEIRSTFNASAAEVRDDSHMSEVFLHSSESHPSVLCTTFDP